MVNELNRKDPLFEQSFYFENKFLRKLWMGIGLSGTCIENGK